MAAQKPIFFKAQPVLKKIETAQAANNQAELSKRIAQWNDFVAQYPFLKDMISDKLKQILLGVATVAKANQQDNPQWDELVKKIDDAIKEIETTLMPIFKNIVALKSESNYSEMLQNLRDKTGWTQPAKDEQNAIFALCARLETEAKTANDSKYSSVAQERLKILEQLDKKISDGLKLLEFNADPALPINAKDKKASKEAVSKTLEITHDKREEVKAQLEKFEKMPETERAQHQTKIANLQKTNDLLQDFLQMKQDFCQTDFTVASEPLEPSDQKIKDNYASWLLFNNRKEKGFNGSDIEEDTEFAGLTLDRQGAIGDLSDDTSHYSKVRLYVIQKNYGARFGMNKTTGKLAIQVDANGNKMEQEARTIHEMQHLIQAKKDELGFYGSGAPAEELYDIWDEVEAYQMQFASVPESFAKYKTKIQNISEITPEWVKKQNDYYSILPNIKLSTGTLIAEIYPLLSPNRKKWYTKQGLANEKGELKPEHKDKSLMNFCELLQIKTF